MTAKLVDESTTLAANVRKILPDIAERAERAERERRVPIENIEDLRRAGYLRAFIPAKYGGLELTPPEFAQATRLIAGSCASTAWAGSLLSAHAHAIASCSPQLQEEIWGADPEALVCSSVAPVGKATPTEGGIRLSGRFSWSSGSQHAQWAFVGFLAQGPSGGPEPHFAVLPRKDYVIEDVWYSMGLKGTGSQDLIIDDVFVPQHRIESMHALNSGTATGFGWHSAPVFRLPFQPVFSLGFSAVTLGAAEAIRERYTQRLAGRVRAYTGAKVAQSAPAVVRLAEATHELRSAARLLEQDWQDMHLWAHSQDPATADETMAWRSNQAFATRLSIRAADRLFEASGGSAVRDDNPMQRFWRDVHTGAAHAYSDYDVAAQSYGSYLAQVQAQDGLF
jgi:alkylation response protein AidB-like acyl-CoA dehydrogenase